ncbi:MAG: hypothetical protein Q4F66_09420 [Clostridium sp.]|nr:hypothetical protein [Clostridium sp.]
MPFILIVIGLVLIVYNYRAIKRENISFEIQDKDSSFSRVLDDNKRGLTEYQIELGVLRKNMGESLTELQEEILDIKTRLNMIEKNKYMYSERESGLTEDTVINKDNNSEDIVSEINFQGSNDIETSIKTDKIKEFLNMGLTEEEICHRLSISKGEVLLVKDLFKK